MTNEPIFNLIACAKDEGLSILEWVAYHRVIGFDNVLIATNDCSDGTDDLVAALDQHGFALHYENKVPEHKFPQRAAYDYLVNQPVCQNADWLMVLDLDEFLLVHTGDGSVQALAAALPETIDLLLIYCAVFGNNNVEKWQNGLVLEQFTTRLPSKHKLSKETKCLLHNPRNFGQLKNHFPNDFRADMLCALDAGRRLIPVDPANFRKMHQDLIVFKNGIDAKNDLAQINHYATKTMDHFLLRAMRGLGYGSEPRYTLAYFRSRNQARISDLRVQGGMQKVKVEIKKMRNIKAIARIEDSIIAEYTEKFKQLHQ